MALVTFNKSISVKYDTITYPADTVHKLTRTFSDKVLASDETTFDPTQIFVSYNGQRIDDVATNRYYYTLASVGAPVTGFTVELCANAAFDNPDYTAPDPVDFTISESDIFYIDYTYQVEIV